MQMHTSIAQWAVHTGAALPRRPSVVGCRTFASSACFAANGSGGSAGRGSGGNGGCRRWGQPGASGGDGGGSSSSSSSGRLRWLLGLGGAASLLLASPVHAFGGGGKGSSKDQEAIISDPYLDHLAELAGPVLSNMGISGVMGVCAAAALKFVGRALAITVGLFFCAVQGLANLGLIEVNWTKVNTEMVKLVDTNNDGKLDERDLKVVKNKVVGLLAQGLPSVGGFVLGFSLGLRLF